MSRIKPVLAVFTVLAAAAAYAGEPSVWTHLKVADAAEANLYGVCFVDAKTGWVVGDKGLCLATKDGGQTWAKLETKSAANLRCVRFNDANIGFACGDGDSAAPPPRGHILFGRPMTSGTLLSTADGGKTWKCNWIPTNFDITCVESSAAPVVQVGASGGAEHPDSSITRSHDGGTKWNAYRCYRALFDIRSLDKQWIAVGSPVMVGFTGPPITDATYINKACRILFSKDAGETWDVSKGSEGKGILRGLAVKKGAPAVAVGDQGSIMLSEDNGENWKAAGNNAAKDTLRGVVWSPTAPLVVAVGKNGAVVYSADGAKTWKVSSATPATLTSVSAAGDAFIAVGEKGTLLRAEAKDLK